jgi:cellulase
VIKSSQAINMSPKTSTLLASLAGAAMVAAHGHVSHIIVNGVYYRNYDPTSDFYNPANAPKVLGWSALNQDNGFVEPNNFGTSEVICHKGAKPGAGHATVAAGDKINIVWTPVSVSWTPPQFPLHPLAREHVF